MPDVGLLSSTEPVSPETKVVIRFSVEVGELPVYNESYDANTLREEVRKDRTAVEEAWLRRFHCVLESRDRTGFSAAVTRCLTDGHCCDCGHLTEGSVNVDTERPVDCGDNLDRSPSQENL